MTKKLKTVTAESEKLEARRRQLRSDLAAAREELSETEAGIATATAAGEPTEALEERSAELRTECARLDAALPLVEHSLSEKRVELDEARRRHLEGAIAEKQGDMEATLTEFHNALPETLEPLRPLVVRCFAHRDELKDLHAERRRLDGRHPLTHVPELEAVYRRVPGIGNQLHVLAQLLERGAVEVEPVPSQPAPEGAAAEVLGRMGSDSDEVQRRLGTGH